MLHYFLLGLLSLTTVLATPNEPNHWEFETSPLATITGDDRLHINPIISHDGSTLSWEADDENTCVYRFEDDQTQCFEWDENAIVRSTRTNLPSISPDGRYVAQTENFFMQLRDSDIWILDTETGEHINRTDDGYYGSAMGSDVPNNLTLDLLPTWHPHTGELLFFRAQHSDPITLELYKMNPDGGDAELVVDLTQAIPGPYAVYQPVAFSDDGTKIAFMAIPAQWHREPDSGIWILDLATNEAELIADIPSLQNALPEWASEGLMPNMLQWRGDHVIVWLEDGSYSAGIRRTPLHIDLQTRNVTSLIDYSPIEAPTDLLEVREEFSVYDMLITGAFSPDNSQYLLLASKPNQANEGELGVLSVPLSGGEVTLVTTIEQALIPRQEAQPTVSEDGKVLMLQTLFSFAAHDAGE